MYRKKENTSASGAGKTFSHKRAFTGCRQQNQGRFNRDCLPEPMAVLKLLGINPKKNNPAGYMALCCPFHAGGQEKNPSLNLHVQDGHYRCHACGAKGGDILAFYMAVTGMKFSEAAKSLGAWDGVK
jgi:hypothetical protein